MAVGPKEPILIKALALRPKRAIEGAVLDSLGNVLGFEVLLAFEVSDGAGYFKDAVVGAGAEPLLGHGALKQVLAVGGEMAEGVHVARRHLRVAVDLFFLIVLKAIELPEAGAHDPLQDLS